MKITCEPSMTRLCEMTYDCDEFWNIVWEQKLENRLENYVDEMYPDGVDLGHLNDVFRFEAADVLSAIGADLSGTIYE